MRSTRLPTAWTTNEIDMTERMCADDWEVNEARESLTLHRRTDEWLIDRHDYYWVEFNRALDRGSPGNWPFARMIAIECEIVKRGMTIPAKRDVKLNRAPVSHGLREAAMYEVE